MHSLATVLQFQYKMGSRYIFVKSLKTDTVFEQVRRKMIFTKFYHNHIVKLAKAVDFGVNLEICPHFYIKLPKRLVDTISDHRQAI